MKSDEWSSHIQCHYWVSALCLARVTVTVSGANIMAGKRDPLVMFVSKPIDKVVSFVAVESKCKVDAL